jgi:hypothetical protein
MFYCTRHILQGLCCHWRHQMSVLRRRESSSGFHPENAAIRSFKQSLTLPITSTQMAPFFPTRGMLRAGQGDRQLLIGNRVIL